MDYNRAKQEILGKENRDIWIAVKMHHCIFRIINEIL